jgi:hypothetical protein
MCVVVVAVETVGMKLFALHTYLGAGNSVTDSKAVAYWWLAWVTLRW